MTRLVLGFAMTAILQVPSFRAETRLVVLHVSVRNARGEMVTTLDRGAFAVYENGKRQPVSVFRRDDIPVSVGLLIDNSGSMRPVRPAVEAAALAFANASHPDDELFVVNFADKARLDVPFTSDRAVLERSIARVDAIGGTAMRDAVEVAEAYLHECGKKDRRALLIITDGNDNASTASLDRIVRAAEQRDVVIYAIGLFGHEDPTAAKRSRKALDQLAEHSGGLAYYPSSIDQVQAVALDIARQIRHQYTVAYTPIDQRLDGSYRTIQVKVSGAERYVVRTRAGYRATP
jgi:Ca-activated chloride channel family protein